MRKLTFTVLAAALAVLGAVAVHGLLAAEETKPPADASAWVPLFNGKDLDGWKADPGAKWTVEDGCIVGQQDNGKVSDLWTTKEYDNFELRFAYKAVWPCNSGVWYRGAIYQFDILEWKDPVTYSGTLYCSGKMFIFKQPDKSLENRDGWNEGQVYANGKHLIHWLNGKKVGECDDDTAAKGKVGIQTHPGDEFKNMKIIVKKIEIRMLKEDDKPTEPATPKTEK
jgi:hypothetical protein